MRFIPWYLFALAGAVGVAVTAPQQLPIVIYKLSLVTLGLVGGYWADRALFKMLGTEGRLNQRTVHLPNGGHRIMARAIVVLAVVLGLTLGL